MKYRVLVKFYEELSKTTKRLEKTRIIADLFKKSTKEDLNHVPYLIRGKVFSVKDERKIGFSSQLAVKAIAQATGASKQKITTLWRKKGDLGKVAELLVKKKKQRTLSSKTLTVKKVHENIQKLATLTGAGTVNRKVSLVAELLSSAKPIEARYIIRTIIEKMRIGVAEGVIRDAIAKECKVESKDIEKAYNLVLDYAEVIRMAKGKRLAKASLSPSRPSKVMLAIRVETLPEAFKAVDSPALLEHKFDGFRCVTGYTPVYVKDKGLLSTKDVKKGDFVLTHKGRFRKIIATNQRVIDKGERLFKFQTFLGNKFRITEKHPILIRRNGRNKWVNTENISKKDYFVFPLPRYDIKSFLDKKLKLITDDGYKKTIPINKFFFRFLGFWIGDGYTNNYHNTERIGLVFNNKTEKKLAKFYKKNIIKYFGIKKVSEYVYKKGTLSIYWRDKEFRKWLTIYFRREWRGKTLPSWFMGISENQFNEFLQGWIESDGHKDKLGRISITTKERDLAMFAQLLALKFKKLIAIKKVVGKVNDYKRVYYRLVIPKRDKHFTIKDNYILIKPFKIEELKRPDPRIRLYNLEVQGDNSYCTTLASLHNCMIHKKDNIITLFSRRMENVTNQFPDIVKEAKECIKGKDYIIDTEVVGYDKTTGKYLPFQKISQRIKRKHNIQKMVKDYPVEVNAFDVLYYNGKSCMKVEQKDRRKLLDKIIKNKKHKIKTTPKLITDNEAKANKFFKESLKDGNEGLIVKSLDAVYIPGRRVGGWVKLKSEMEPLDLVIVGAQWGEGKRSKWLSSFDLACRGKGKLLTIGKVGTGIKEKAEGVTFKQLTKALKPLITETKAKHVKVKPKLVVEIGYEEIQKSPTYDSGYALRFPKVLRLRESTKRVSDANTLQDVQRLYRHQKKT